MVSSLKFTWHPLTVKVWGYIASNKHSMFLKDLKKLKKKLPSLEGDLKNFEKFIHSVDFDNNKRFVTLTNELEKGVRIIKTRLMVRSLKGSSKTRLIFSLINSSIILILGP